jgi:hypothetical protein
VRNHASPFDALSEYRQGVYSHAGRDQHSTSRCDADVVAAYGWAATHGLENLSRHHCVVRPGVDEQDQVASATRAGDNGSA